MQLDSAGAEAVEQQACAWNSPEVDSRQLILNSGAFHAGKCFDFMQISESSLLEEENKEA